jgi:hypothetical protein
VLCGSFERVIEQKHPHTHTEARENTRIIVDVAFTSVIRLVSVSEEAFDLCHIV